MVRWQLHQISFSDIAMIVFARTYLLSYFWLGVWSVLYNEFLYVWSRVRLVSVMRQQAWLHLFTYLLTYSPLCVRSVFLYCVSDLPIEVFLRVRSVCWQVLL